MPWRRALREEIALPSGVAGPVEREALAAEAALPAGVTGPRDLAPLARDDSMRRAELMAQCGRRGRVDRGGNRKVVDYGAKIPAGCA